MANNESSYSGLNTIIICLHVLLSGNSFSTVKDQSEIITLNGGGGRGC